MQIDNDSALLWIAPDDHNDDPQFATHLRANIRLMEYAIVYLPNARAGIMPAVQVLPNDDVELSNTFKVYFGQGNMNYTLFIGNEKVFELKGQRQQVPVFLKRTVNNSLV